MDCISVVTYMYGKEIEGHIVLALPTLSYHVFCTDAYEFAYEFAYANTHLVCYIFQSAATVTPVNRGRGRPKKSQAQTKTVRFC